MSVGREVEDKSTPHRIADALRDDLLDGLLGPGARVTEESLAERFGAGRYSVRAALQTLVAEGLLEHHRNRGIVVPEVTAERIDAMCSYRAILELGALRLALEKRTDFAEVSAAVEQLESLPASAPWRRVIEAHSAVHRNIVAASGNARLAATHAACELELSCMLATIRKDYTAQRLTRLHRALVEQLLAGGETAVQALEDDLELGGRAAMLTALRRRDERSARARSSARGGHRASQQ